MIWDPVTLRELPDREVTDLHLLRHGEVDTGGERLAYGHLDLPLSRRGRSESEALIDLALALPRPAGVISSDLGRCLGVAEPLAERLGVPLERVPALREQSMGAWEGRSWADLTDSDPAGTHAWWADYLNAPAPEGESLAQLFARVQTWFSESWPRLRGRRWIVVSHIGVIRGLLCQFFRFPPDEALRLAPARASHTWVQLAQAGPVLQVLGEKPSTPVLDNQAPRRIALSGSAGTGKTTLGRALARALDLPFIEEGMRRRLEGGLDLHQLTHEQHRSLNVELWEEQKAEEARMVRENGGFVADRSAVDFAAFWFQYRFAWDEEATTAFMGDALGHARSYDRILLLPWGQLPLVADGVRSTNRWLQRSFQAQVQGLLIDEIPPEVLLRVPALQPAEARLSWVLRRL